MSDVDPFAMLEEEAVTAVVVARPAAMTKEEEIESQLREMENNLLQQSLEQLDAAGDWPEVAVEFDPKEDKDIPQKWIQKYGLEEARKRYRISRAGMMSQKHAPVALKHSVTLATGIIKARAHEKTGPKILNLTLVKMPEVRVSYPEQEVFEK